MQSGGRYRTFENRAHDEEEWSKREKFFNSRGYQFRPRLRQGWTPSWYATGESPLDAEDGEVLKVPLSPNRSILRLDDITDPPR